MTERRVRERAAEILARFRAAGAVEIDPPILQPADILLDLYGEDIRGRAYVTSDALRGEQMLRPDFTVPVVRWHMQNGAEPARYAYAGEVFRRQDSDPDRENEYVQVGFEIFDRDRPEAADAEVFAIIAEIVRPAGLVPTTGDIGILTAAVEALDASARRKAALRRHIWRPRRFRALIDRYAGRSPVPPARAALLAASDPFAEAGPALGLRGREEIEARIAALRADAEEGPLPEVQVALLDEIVSLRGTARAALERLRDIAVDMPGIRPAVDRLERRLDALAARGVAADDLAFEASYGRTSMEYYDGFVFGFFAPARPDLPPVATGGRYDALTARLGRGRSIPAVGAVVRPRLLIELEAGREGVRA